MITLIKEFENKVLLPNELNRVQPLVDHASSNGIEFKYFTTINYHYRNTNYKKVVEDNRRIRFILRKVFGYGIRFYFFIERHTDPEQKCYGGYHKHILIEEIPDHCFVNRTKKLDDIMFDVAPELIFASKFGDPLKACQKIKVLNKVIRSMCKNVPNGLLGLHTEPVTNVEGVLAYCSKQFEMFKFGKLHRWYEVLDARNSDCDFNYMLDRYDRKQQQTRYQAVLT